MFVVGEALPFAASSLRYNIGMQTNDTVCVDGWMDGWMTGRISHELDKTTATTTTTFSPQIRYTTRC